MVITGDVELATGTGGDFYDDAPGKIDKARLFSDRGYLLSVVCGHFQAVDTYHRGLITANAFSRALQAVGLRYGQREVEDILQHCTITDDGYVHYKELMRVVGPLTPRAKQSTAKGTIFPLPEEEGLHHGAARPVEATPTRSRPPSASLAAWEGRSTEVRRIYSRWERGSLSSAGFKAELKDLGIQPTDELDHLLCVYGPSRAMPFRKLMYALQIDENDGRRARNNHHGGRQFEPPPTAAEFARDGPAASETPDVWQGAYGATGGNPPNSSLRQAICDFVDGRIPAVAFRQQLRRCGVSMTSMLDRLIRMHECDNSVRFQDLARLLLLQDKREQVSEAGATPSYTRSPVDTPLPSGAQTPSSSVGGYGPANGGGPLGGPGYPPRGGLMVNDLRFGTPPDPRGGYPAQASHRGQRQDDVRSLLVHGQQGQGGRSRSAASCSHGHRHPDDVRSVASHQASDGWEPGAHDDSHCMQPPFATTWDLGTSRPRPAPRPASATRAGGNSGDIIGWKDRPEQEPPPPPPRFAATAAEALMQWPNAEADAREEEAPSRFGKRHYGTPLPAGDAAPFGRTSDVEPSGRRRPPAATPFGTDQDLGLPRPEDAGTDEYRVAVHRTRRGY